MQRRARRKEALFDKARGVLLGLLGTLLILALAGITYWVRTSRPKIDPISLCLESGPAVVHVLLFDRSDPITGQQAQHIRQVIQRTKADAPVGTRFDIYTFEGDTLNEMRPDLSICVPPRDGDIIIENRERIKKRYDEGFSKVLDKAVDDLLIGSTRPSSPIIESTRAAVQTSFGPINEGSTPLRLTLISDMIQHSTITSHLRAKPDFVQLSKSPDWASLRPRLKGAETDILYLLRPGAVRGSERVQVRGHQAFWEQLIAEAGGRLLSIEPF